MSALGWFVLGMVVTGIVASVLRHLIEPEENGE